MYRLIETISLLILIGVAALRPLVAESYDPSSSSLSQALVAVADPSPMRTLIFDALILVSASGWLLVRAVGSPRTYRRTGLEVGAVLVLVAVVVSCFFAGNKRLAINATIDWLCLPVLTIALVQLMPQRWHRGLLLSALLASACVQVAQCVEQRLVGFDETWEHYQSIKEDFWGRQGVDLDSARVDAFERRIQAREASGFLPHSNVAGSYLVLCALAALGLVIAAWKVGAPRADAGTEAGESTEHVLYLARAGSTLTFALIAIGVVLTNSAGAMIAGVAGLVLWLGLCLLGRWVVGNRTKALVIGWVVAGAGLLAVAGHGLQHDRLPSWSLTFRWQYWRASSELIADHPFTGVGRENFGRHYLRYKPIEGPEEVANPHNLFVQAAADWGVLGLLGVAAMMIGASRCVTRPMPVASAPSSAGTDVGEPGMIIACGLLVALVIILGRLPLLGTDDPNFLYYSAVTVGAYWVLGFFCFASCWWHQEGDRNVVERLATTGAAVGLFAFLVHDMINFALFVPGSATTFFALLAFCIAGRSAPGQQEDRCSAVSRWLPLLAAVIALLAVALVGVIPVARARHYLSLARQAGPRPASAPLAAQVADHYFNLAAEADPFDPTPLVERAEWLMQASVTPEMRDEAFRLAGESLENAAKRDPFSIGLWRMQMRLHLARATVTGDARDYAAAITAARIALKRYPLDPHGITLLADCQLEAGEAVDSPELLREAIENYERALDLDGARPLWGELARLHLKEREAVELKIQRTRRLLDPEGG